MYHNTMRLRNRRRLGIHRPELIQNTIQPEQPSWVRRGHTRKPNFVVRFLYGLFDWFGDFGPMFRWIGRGIWKTARGTWDFLVKAVMLSINLLLVVGIIYLSVRHSYRLLIYAGLEPGLEAFVGVGLFETVFIYCSIVIDLANKNGKRSTWAWVAFLIGFVFVEVSNYTGMANNWVGRSVGITIPFLLLVMKKVLEHQFKKEEKPSWFSLIFNWLKSKFEKKKTDHQPAKTGAKTVTNSDIKAGAVDTNPGGKMDVKLDAKVDMKTDGQAGAADIKLDTKVDAQTDVKPDVKADIKPGTEGVKADVETGAKLDAEVDTTPGAQVDAKTDARTDAQAGVEADVQTDANAGVKPDAKSGVEVDTKPDTQTDVKPDTEPGVETDGKVDAETDTKSDADDGAKADTETDTKVDADDGMKVDAQAGRKRGAKKTSTKKSTATNDPEFKEVKRWAKKFQREKGKVPGRVEIQKKFGFGKSLSSRFAARLKEELEGKAS